MNIFGFIHVCETISEASSHGQALIGFTSNYGIADGRGFAQYPRLPDEHVVCV